MLMLIVVTVFVCIWLWSKLSGKRTIKDLHSRHVLITGCDTGFGNLLARTLDSAGVPVFAGCLTQHGKQKLEAQSSRRLRAIYLDVTEKTSLQRALQFVTAAVQENGLWGLVNNAATITPFMPLELLNDDSISKVIDVNLHGPIRVTKTFLPLIRKAKGRIVNVSSGITTTPVPGMVPYGASKAGLEAFSDCLRRELYNCDVTVHIIAINALFNTNMQFESFKEGREIIQNADEESRQFYTGNILDTIQTTRDGYTKYLDSDLNKVIDAERHALFSISPKSRYNVGHNVLIWIIRQIPDFVVDYLIGWPKPGPSTRPASSFLCLLRKTN